MNPGKRVLCTGNYHKECKTQTQGFKNKIPMEEEINVDSMSLINLMLLF